MLPLPGLSPVSDKTVVAKFDGGLLSSDGGVLALREVEQRLLVAERLAACIEDLQHTGTCLARQTGAADEPVGDARRTSVIGRCRQPRLPKRWSSSASNPAASGMAFSGSNGSARPRTLAVPGMNWAMPWAPTGLMTLARKLDMIELYPAVDIDEERCGGLALVEPGITALECHDCRGRDQSSDSARLETFKSGDARGNSHVFE
jgi:hypothetical protein